MNLEGTGRSIERMENIKLSNNISDIVAEGN